MIIELKCFGNYENKIKIAHKLWIFRNESVQTERFAWWSLSVKRKSFEPFVIRYDWYMRAVYAFMSLSNPGGRNGSKEKMHYFSKLKLKEQKVLRHVMTYTDSSSVSTCRNNKLLGFQMNKFCKNKIKNIYLQKLHNLYVL